LANDNHTPMHWRPDRNPVNKVFSRIAGLPQQTAELSTGLLQCSPDADSLLRALAPRRQTAPKNVANTSKERHAMDMPARPTLTTFILCAALLGAAAPAAADISADILAAMQSDARSPAEKARDANRKPAETLAFFGLRPDMRVLELVPGGAWYTKLLAPVLADKGKLYVALGTQRVEQMLADGALAGVEVVKVEGNFTPAEGSRRFDLPGLRLDVRNLDLVLTFRNLHNFTESGRRALNEESFRVLKKGGLYGVVDHTRRHMQSDNSENWRRMDPVLMIKEIEAVGFEFVATSDLHYRFDDELIYEVGRRSVSGNTDRFTLLFRKP
jgi:predicted methyltransferase